MKTSTYDVCEIFFSILDKFFNEKKKKRQVLKYNFFYPQINIFWLFLIFYLTQSEAEQ